MAIAIHVADGNAVMGGIHAASGGALFEHGAEIELPAHRPRVITTRPHVPISDQELRARVQWDHRTSPHFALTYDRVAFADRSASILDTLETAYNQIFHFTHESFTDRFHVYAIDQRAATLLGCTVEPHFNLDERAIYLVETSRHRAENDIGRNVTHAMRIARVARHYHDTPGWAALEEGFGIFLSERLAITKECFPLFGAHPDVIAHHLTLTHGVSLGRFWPSAPERLAADQLALLGAFFLYLGDTFSDDRVVAFSKSEDPITPETFRSCFGETLDELEFAWVQRLPVSLVALTQSEKDAMLQKWEQAIEGQWHS
ncbi:MAG: hypothetical protein Q8922_11280 [Bacteroidota bacterium]|nr:hypothetical protein [Bacteroidota bacterium]MDP4233955.1 hypothetical protein [Bacteroidota bacterium]MDP4242794.1 hypothetical protein [Bacteroidota bacterium]MDP4288508.1 hypothetical protein [Bacteroidota bacterium]